MAALKARDVRERCKGRVDPQVQFCLEALAEQQSVMRQEVMSLAQMLNQMMGILNSLVTVGENMKNATDELQKVRGGDDDLPPVTG